MERELEPEVMETRRDAEAYDAMDHGAPNTAFVDRLVQLGAGGYSLDIGTGNGLIPLRYCDRAQDAICVGVDMSQNMIDIAMRHRATSRVAGRVTFKIADARQLHFDDGAFDTVFSNTIMHHMDDPRPYLAEAWRVLRRGGVLLIRDLFRPADGVTVEALVAQHCGGEDAYGQQLFRQSLIAAFTPDELRQIVADLGWANVEVVVDTDRHVSIQTAAKP
jgi:ubiquinone/menaquinone biosynthesis C-methylase UbiE